MVNRVQAIRSSTAGNRPTGRLPGEIYTNWADKQLGVIDSSSNAMDLIGVRYFSTTSNYAAGDFVVQGGGLYRANAAVSAAAFNAASWTLIGFVATGATTPSNPVAGQLWYNGSQLQVYSGAAWMSSAGVPTISTGTTTPTNPVAGQLWYNGSLLQVYSGSAWVSAAGIPTVSTGTTAPTNPVAGQLWYNGTQLQVYSGGVWVVTVPPADLNFSTSATYAQGAVALYNGELITANKALTPQAFAPVNFTSVRQRRNRVLNGGPATDTIQWGLPVTFTPSTQSWNYVCDRWYAQLGLATTAHGGGGSITTQVVSMNTAYSTPLLPAAATINVAGLDGCIAVKSNAAYAIPANNYACTVYAMVDANNTKDWAWGGAQAQPITMSFMVYASQAGTWGGILQSNNRANPPTNTQWRVYPFTYSIPTANTWTQIAITIPGDTTLPALWQGAVNISGGSSLWIVFDLGTSANLRGTAGAWVTTAAIGTSTAPYQGATGTNSLVTMNGATWAISRLQVELGTIMSPFDWMSYNEVIPLVAGYYQQNNPYGPAGTNTGGGSAGCIEFWNPSGDNIVGWGGQVFLPYGMNSVPGVGLYALDGTGGAVSTNLGNVAQGIGSIGTSSFWGAVTGTAAVNDVLFYYECTCEPPY